MQHPVEVDAPRQEVGAGARPHGERLARERRLVHCRRAVEHGRVDRDEIARFDDDLIADSDTLYRNLLQLPVPAAVSDTRGAREQGFEGARRPPQRVALQRFAAGLHQHDDGAREVLPQERRADDGERRDDVGSEAAPPHAVEGLEDERRAAREEGEEEDPFGDDR